MTKFPHLLAAVEAREKHLQEAECRDQWAIGAAILKDCYPDGFKMDGAGHRDGSRVVLEAASKELAKLGYVAYTAQYLARMARTAHVFPASRRYSEISFSAHSEAKNPDMLDWIVKQNKGEKGLSVPVARAWVERWEILQVTKRKEKFEAVKEKKRQATTLDEKRKATEELKKLGNQMPTPRSEFTPPSKKDQSRLANMADVLDIDGQAMLMTKNLRKNFAALEEMRDSIDPGLIGALVENHRLVAEVATQIADLLSKSKKGRFTVVNERTA